MSFKIERWNQPYPPNPANLRSILAAEGYRVFQRADRPQTIYGVHKHPEDQTHWVISGALEIKLLSGETYLLNAGDRDFLPAETYYAAHVVGDEFVLYLVGEKLPPKLKKKKRTEKKAAGE